MHYILVIRIPGHFRSKICGPLKFFHVMLEMPEKNYPKGENFWLQVACSKVTCGKRLITQLLNFYWNLSLFRRRVSAFLKSRKPPFWFCCHFSVFQTTCSDRTYKNKISIKNTKMQYTYVAKMTIGCLKIAFLFSDGTNTISNLYVINRNIASVTSSNTLKY